MDFCCEKMLDAKLAESDEIKLSNDGLSDENLYTLRKIQKINESDGKQSYPSNGQDDLKATEKTKALKRWSAEEEKRLLELFYKFGNNWEEIATNLPGRAASGVKNRFYCISKRSLPNHTVHKIKQAHRVKKLYTEPKNSNELFRKINNYLRDECIFESFLAFDKPTPYSDLVYKLKMTPQDLENYAKMQMLLEKAQQLYISCEKAKQNLSELQRNGLLQQ